MTRFLFLLLIVALTVSSMAIEFLAIALVRKFRIASKTVAQILKGAPRD